MYYLFYYVLCYDDAFLIDICFFEVLYIVMSFRSIVCFVFAFYGATGRGTFVTTLIFWVMYPACGKSEFISLTSSVNSSTGGKVLPVIVVTSTYPRAPINKPVPPMIVPG